MSIFLHEANRGIFLFFCMINWSKKMTGIIELQSIEATNIPNKRGSFVHHLLRPPLLSFLTFLNGEHLWLDLHAVTISLFLFSLDQETDSSPKRGRMKERRSSAPWVDRVFKRSRIIESSVESDRISSKCVRFLFIYTEYRSAGGSWWWWRLLVFQQHLLLFGTWIKRGWWGWWESDRLHHRPHQAHL